MDSKTLYKRHLEEMDREFKHFKPENTGKKGGFFSKNKSDSSSNSIVNWINRRESTCFICTSVQNTFQAYMKTFFDMYNKHPEFREQVAATKGFCLDHFKVLCEGADEMLSEKERKDILASCKREKSRPAMPEKLVFSELSFEEKKIVAAQFIERIEVTEDSAEIKWTV